MHFEVATATDAFPESGIIVAESPSEARAKLSALFAAALLVDLEIAIVDASIAAVAGGRLFMISCTFAADGRTGAPVFDVHAEIFRGENPAELEAERSRAYLAWPLETLILDKACAGSNGREFWNLQLFRRPGA